MSQRGSIALAGSVATMSASGVVAALGIASDVVVALASFLAAVLAAWAMVAPAVERLRARGEPTSTEGQS